MFQTEVAMPAPLAQFPIADRPARHTSHRRLNRERLFSHRRTFVTNPPCVRRGAATPAAVQGTAEKQTTKTEMIGASSTHSIKVKSIVQYSVFYKADVHSAGKNGYP